MTINIFTKEYIPIEELILNVFVEFFLYIEISRNVQNIYRSSQIKGFVDYQRAQPLINLRLRF